MSQITARVPDGLVKALDAVAMELKQSRVKSSATRELARIPKQIRLRIVHAIDNLGDHPLSGKPLKGEFSGLRRVRVGADGFAKVTILN